MNPPILPGLDLDTPVDVAGSNTDVESGGTPVLEDGFRWHRIRRLPKKG
ncbi:MAG TPA: hypothetical protein VM571_00925 [Noviherbaspirillum sp.]|nr:hypothetical protein [Noviherbaspirillum sp.]